MQENTLVLFDDEWLEEEDLPDSSSQATLTFYLRSVLKWLYRQEDWYVPGNFQIQKAGVTGKAAPDVAVHKGYTNKRQQRELPKSWRIDPSRRPVPPVVFEISSDATWEKDLVEKVVLYGQLGVQEYFAYDPDSPRNWKDRPQRLLGWRYENEQPHVLEPDTRGWLWSQELNSWLSADEEFLRLREPNGQLRLDEAQMAIKEQAAREVAQADQEAAQKAKEAERIAREAAQSELEALRAKLRAKNIDPDTL